MGKHHFRRELGEHVDVVGHPHLVELVEPLRPAHQETEPEPGQTQFRQRAHHHEVRQAFQVTDEALAREGVIRLIQHDQPRSGSDDALDHRPVEQVAGRVVRVGDEHQCRPMFADRRHQGSLVEREIRFQRDADEGDAGEHREQPEHHERWLDPDDDTAGPGNRECQQLDDLVGAVAQEQLDAGGHPHGRAQLPLQARGRRVRVAVDRRGRDGPGDLIAHHLWQRIGILHRIQLHHAGGVGHGIGRQRQHIGPQDGLGSRCARGSEMGHFSARRGRRREGEAQRSLGVGVHFGGLHGQRHSGVDAIARGSGMCGKAFTVGEFAGDVAERGGAGPGRLDQARPLLEIVHPER